jgi:hypothetical protein
VWAVTESRGRGWWIRTAEVLLLVVEDELGLVRSRDLAGADRPDRLVGDHHPGKRMSIVGFITDAAAIGHILDHLGLSTPEAEKPPPPVRELLRVAEHEDGWGVPAQWE